VGSSIGPVLDLLVRARRRLTAAALADAFAGPLAGFLLVAAAILAVARWTGREDLPGGVLAAAAVLALLAAAARVARGVPGYADAAFHLDRALGAEERFSTVLETAESDPAVAEWAARGALARAGDGNLRKALAVAPPAALLPLLLAATLVAGLELLPAAKEGTAAVLPAGRTGTAGGTVASSSPSATVPGAKPDPREVLRDLEAKARAEGNQAALAAIAEARAALDADSGSTVPGATGGGAAARGDGTPAPADPAFRPLPVPLRARESVRRYFGSGR
jgi:hypothetical protein